MLSRLNPFRVNFIAALLNSTPRPIFQTILGGIEINHTAGYWIVLKHLLLEIFLKRNH